MGYMFAGAGIMVVGVFLGSALAAVHYKEANK